MTTGTWARRTVLALGAAWTMAFAGAAAAQTVTMYTAMPTNILTALQPAFKAKTGIEIQAVTAGSGEILKRLQAEAGRPLADVVVSIGADGIDANPALFERYEPNGLANVVPGIRVSQNWIPFTVTIPTVLAVNTRLVPAAEIPTTWRELADPKWKGKIAYAGADRSGTAMAQLLQVLHNFGETEGWALFGRMMDNFVVTGSSSGVIRGAAQGEYAMALTIEDFAQSFIDGGAPIKLVFPKEGVTMSADAMALVAKGPNPAAGKALLDYIVSAEAQALIVKASARRPIRTDVAASDKATPASAITVNSVPAAWAAAKNKEVLERYTRLARR